MTHLAYEKKFRCILFSQGYPMRVDLDAPHGLRVWHLFTLLYVVKGIIGLSGGVRDLSGGTWRDIYRAAMRGARP